MYATVGDRLVVAGSGRSAARVGVIVAVSEAGRAPFWVRWEGDGHESRFWPGPDAHLDEQTAEPEDQPEVRPETSEQPAGTMHARTWHVEVYLTESGNETTAHAVLKGDAPDAVRAAGTTRRNPHDPAVPEIGDEVAAARALRALSDTLIGLASGDIADVTGKPVTHLTARP